MSLDLVAAMAQIEALAGRMRNVQAERAARLSEARSALAQSTAYILAQRAGEAQGRFVFPYADPLDDPARRHPRPDVPTDYTVIAADGSHIDVDRHLPVRCFLINIGLCRLVYGGEPGAHLDHTARLYTEPEELSIVDPESPLNSYALEGPLLGIKRTVDEVAALADAVEDAPADLPLLLLVDGSLVLWPLGGEGPPPGRFPAYVRSVLLEQGFLRSMERLRQVAKARTVVPAAYISLPGSREVAGALRLALCPHTPVGDCGRHCRAIAAGQRGCDAVHGFSDRELYAESLVPGERTALFASRASVVRDHYGDHHRIRFFYLNVGEEMARVEVPAWVADDPRLVDLVHGLLLEQCRLGDGYPVALQEAHLFASRASVVRDHYGDHHRIRFFYLNVGEEMARVEVPAWVVGDPRLVDLVHGLLLEQCRLGDGYPVALQEAHEQAVLTGADREGFRHVLELALEGQRLPVFTSEKQRSKRLRGV